MGSPIQSDALGSSVSHAGADALAAGSTTTVGDFVQHPDFGELWFSEQFSFSDFADLGIPVNEDMSKNIACFEALAQGALIFSASALLPACRVRVILKSLSDNAAAEAGLNSLFTTAFPLALFLRGLRFWRPRWACTLRFLISRGSLTTEPMPSLDIQSGISLQIACPAIAFVFPWLHSASVVCRSKCRHSSLKYWDDMAFRSVSG